MSFSRTSRGRKARKRYRKVQKFKEARQAKLEVNTMRSIASLGEPTLASTLVQELLEVFTGMRFTATINIYR